MKSFIIFFLLGISELNLFFIGLKKKKKKLLKSRAYGVGKMGQQLGTLAALREDLRDCHHRHKLITTYLELQTL